MEDGGCPGSEHCFLKCFPWNRVICEEMRLGEGDCHILLWKIKNNYNHIKNSKSPWVIKTAYFVIRVCQIYMLKDFFGILGGNRVKVSKVELEL